MSDLDIPKASKPKRGEYLIAVPVQTALKAALYLAMRKAGITRVELVRRLRIDEEEARRMLDPHHPTKADRFERALAPCLVGMRNCALSEVSGCCPASGVPESVRNYHTSSCHYRSVSLTMPSGRCRKALIYY